MTKTTKRPLLEESLLSALSAVDKQIARAMERTPSQREVHGVQKWKPLDERVEKLCELLLSEYGEEYQLDSLLVFARSFVKSLSILCDELGGDSFGEIRSAYIKETLQMLEDDVLRAKGVFKRDETSLM